jgi:hypothetical protein
MGGKRPRQSHGVSALPDDAGVTSVAYRPTREPTFNASQRRTGSNLADLGRTRRAPDLPHHGGGELPDMSAGLRGGRGEVLRGSRGHVAAVESAQNGSQVPQLVTGVALKYTLAVWRNGSSVVAPASFIVA